MIKFQEAAWKVTRQNLHKIELLGGYQVLGYKSFKNFCQAEFLELPKAYIFNELTFGYFELKVFEVPLCTFEPNWFNHSNCQRAFKIRESCGKNQWRFNQKAIARAKQVYLLAQERSRQNYPHAEVMKSVIIENQGNSDRSKLTPLRQVLSSFSELQRKYLLIQQSLALLNKHPLPQIQKNEVLRLLEANPEQAWLYVQKITGSRPKFKQVQTIR
ncbi:MAG: hypothetical protein HC820_04310 [Hydrococcus sp. RM1_1_31]|nr:hypothetical protein [Hydrococcus sp. RM1_1_31]